MLKRQSRLFTRLTISCDLAAVVLAFLLACHLTRAWEHPSAIRPSLWVLLVILPTWHFLLRHYRFYASIRVRTISDIFLSLLNVHIIGGVVAASAIYFLGPRGVHRGLLALFPVLSFVLLGAEKAAQKGVLGFARRRGYNFRHILVVGSNRKARGFIDLLDNHPGWGLKIVGVLDLAGEESVGRVGGHEVLGTLDQVVEICRDHSVDEVAFCVPTRFLDEVDDYLVVLEEMGITVRMVLDFFDLSRTRRELLLAHEMSPIFMLRAGAFGAGRMFLKRCLDVAGAAVGLLLTGVAFPFIAAAIRIDSPGPILFSQKRIGENGCIFRCRKFRSMHVGADSRKLDLLPKNEMNGAAFKMKNDPRVTRVGRFLRRTSLDELPQFWNILRGEMSLVGTRPPTPDEVEQYENWHQKRICIRPGLTGLWQVSGRNLVTDFDEIARLDIRYIESWSLWLDIKILFKTFHVILSRQGSY